MPIDQSRLDRLISVVDEFLKLRKQEEQAPFADSPPQRIHGEGEKADQEFWPAKTRVPVPIEKI
jgi:hypothetical protein